MQQHTASTTLHSPCDQAQCMLMFRQAVSHVMSVSSESSRTRAPAVTRWALAA